MRKRNSVIVAALFIVFAANSLSFAQDTNYSAQNKVALGEDLLKEVIKNTIYQVGNKVIEKYGPGSNFLNNFHNNNSAKTIVAPTVAPIVTPIAIPSVTTTTTAGTTDNAIQEELIPVS